jgi:hypothetical protein
MNLNQYLKQHPNATLRGGWSEWLKRYRFTLAIDEQPFITCEAYDVLTAIQAVEQYLIAHWNEQQRRLESVA